MRPTPRTMAVAVIAVTLVGGGALAGRLSVPETSSGGDELERARARVAQLEARNRQQEEQLAALAARVPLPQLVGLAVDDAEDVTDARGWTLEAEPVPSDEDRGTVVTQSPAPGTVLELGSTVRVEYAIPDEAAG